VGPELARCVHKSPPVNLGLSRTPNNHLKHKSINIFVLKDKEFKV
jgi:hypothetical protein